MSYGTCRNEENGANKPLACKNILQAGQYLKLCNKISCCFSLNDKLFV